MTICGCLSFLSCKYRFMPCAKSQVSEAAISLTVSPGRFYSFSTLLPCNLFSSIKAIFKGQLPPPSLDWIQPSLPGILFSLQIHACPGQCCPSNIQGTCVSPLCTVGPWTLFVEPWHGPQQVFQSAYYTPNYSAWSLGTICSTINTPFPTGPVITFVH